MVHGSKQKYLFRSFLASIKNNPGWITFYILIYCVVSVRQDRIDYLPALSIPAPKMPFILLHCEPKLHNATV